MKYSILLVSIITFGMAYAGFTCGSISYGDGYIEKRVKEVGGYDFNPQEGDFSGTPPYIRVPLHVQSTSGRGGGEGSNHWVVVDRNKNIVGGIIYGVSGYTKCL